MSPRVAAFAISLIIWAGILAIVPSCGHHAGYPGDGANQLWKTIPQPSQP